MVGIQNEDGVIIWICQSCGTHRAICRKDFPRRSGLTLWERCSPLRDCDSHSVIKVETFAINRIRFANVAACEWSFSSGSNAPTSTRRASMSIGCAPFGINRSASSTCFGSMRAIAFRVNLLSSSNRQFAVKQEIRDFLEAASPHLVDVVAAIHRPAFGSTQQICRLRLRSRRRGRGCKLVWFL